MFRTATALVIGLSLAASVAQAQPTSASVDVQGTVSRTVHFGDLDVGSSGGAKQLAFRIRVAAYAVCGGDNVIAREDHDFAACVRGSVNRAATRLDIASLNAALGRGGSELANR